MNIDENTNIILVTDPEGKWPSIEVLNLKARSFKLYYNKYMIASTQITNTEIFAFIAVLVFKLFSHEVLFINNKLQ